MGCFMLYVRGRQSPARGPNPARKLCQSGPQRSVSCNIITGPRCHLWSGPRPADPAHTISDRDSVSKALQFDTLRRLRL